MERLLPGCWLSLMVVLLQGPAARGISRHEMRTRSKMSTCRSVPLQVLLYFFSALALSIASLIEDVDLQSHADDLGGGSVGHEEEGSSFRSSPNLGRDADVENARVGGGGKSVTHGSQVFVIGESSSEQEPKVGEKEDPAIQGFFIPLSPMSFGGYSSSDSANPHHTSYSLSKSRLIPNNHSPSHLPPKTGDDYEYTEHEFAETEYPSFLDEDTFAFGPRDREDSSYSPQYEYDEYYDALSHYDTQDFPTSLSHKGRHCKTVNKDGMTCMMCKDNEGGHSEHCLHSSHHANNRGFANRHRSNRGNRDPEVAPPEAQDASLGKFEGAEGGVEWPGVDYVIRRHKEPSTFSKETLKEFYNPTADVSGFRSGLKDYPFSDGISYDPYEGSDFDPAESKYAEYESGTPDVVHADDHRFDLDGYGFADGNKYEPYIKTGSSDFNGNSIPKGFRHQEENDADLTEMLEEFTKKDRSPCTKMEKEGRACYVCRMVGGGTDEECMSVDQKPIRPQD